MSNTSPWGDIPNAILRMRALAAKTSPIEEAIQGKVDMTLIENLLRFCQERIKQLTLEVDALREAVNDADPLEIDEEEGDDDDS
jgi:hypothetical protein